MAERLSPLIPWRNRWLRCEACARSTVRPPFSERPCAWCGGQLGPSPWEPPSPPRYRPASPALEHEEELDASQRELIATTLYAAIYRLGTLGLVPVVEEAA